MKNIILKEIQFQNFKGIESKTITFDPKITNIYGENGSGKTSIADGISWVLSDKPFEPNPEFNPKPLDQHSEEIPKLETSVKLTFLEDGIERTFQKILKEKYTKKQTTGDVVFSGNVKTYYVDNINVSKEKDFKKFVNELIPEDLIRNLMNPWAFSSDLNWTGRRSFLMNMVDDINNQDIIDNHPKYEEVKPLIKMLDRTPIEQIQKSIQTDIKSNIKERDSIPLTMEELQKLKTKRDYTQIEKETMALLETKEQLKLTEIKLSPFKIKEELQQKIQKLQELKNTLINQDHQKHQQIMERYNQLEKQRLDEKTKITMKIDELQRNINRINHIINQGKIDLDNMGQEFRNINQQYKIESEKEFPQDQKTCPTCHQNLPQDQLNSLIQNFNIQKAENLRKYQAQLTQNQKNGLQLAEELNKQAKNKEVSLESISKEKAKLDLLRQAHTKPELTPNPKIEIIDKQLKEIDEQIAKEQEQDTTEEKRKEIQLQIQELDKQIAEKKTILLEQEQNNKIDTQIVSHKKKLKELSAQILNDEKKLQLITDFHITKINALEEKINSLFSEVQVKLFETLNNGKVIPTCKILVLNETTNAMVPIGGANDAAKVKGGIDIINTLNDFYQITFPIIIDKRGEVSDIPETKSQVINLFVDSGNTELSTEPSTNKE